MAMKRSLSNPELNIVHAASNYEEIAVGEGVRVSERAKTMTEKGKSYQLQTLDKKLAKAFRAWRTKIIKVESALADAQNVTVLQDCRKALLSRMTEITSIYVQIETTANEEELTTFTERYDNWFNENTLLVSRINVRITELREELVDSISSYCKKSAASKISHKTSVASSSRSSSTARKRNEMATKAARLNTELKFLAVENAKEAELKRIGIMKELAATKAEMEAVLGLECERFTNGDGPDIENPQNKDSSDQRLQHYLKTQLESVSSGGVSHSFVPITSNEFPSGTTRKMAPNPPDPLENKLNPFASPFAVTSSETRLISVPVPSA